jgi:TrkA domain protein
VEVKQELLPGAGLRFEFDNRDGDRIGITVQRNGDFEFVVDEG